MYTLFVKTVKNVKTVFFVRKKCHQLFGAAANGGCENEIQAADREGPSGPSGRVLPKRAPPGSRSRDPAEEVPTSQGLERRSQGGFTLPTEGPPSA